MLAARATARRASRLARHFATAVDTAGFKVAAVDNGQPTSSVTFLIKAGSRFETKPGVAHVLKNFAFKSTARRSALGIVRESELFGGVLSSSLTREHIAFTAEFMRGDEDFFVNVLSSLVTSSKFTRWELEESVLPAVEAETHGASADPATLALELAHAVAFRTGLGAPVFAPPHSFVTAEDVKAYAASAFTTGNIAVLGTGIDQGTLAQLVQKHLAPPPTAAAPPSAAASRYFGGETRHTAPGAPTVFVGFGTAGGARSAELSVLASLLSPAPSLKWAQGTSALAAALPPDTAAQTVLLPYSDAALFGVLVQGATAGAVRAGAQAAVKVLQDAAGKGGVKPDELKKAVAKAKFAAASAVEQRDGLVATFGPQLLAGSPSSLDSTFAALDKVDAAAFSKVVSALVKTTPTYVAVGDVTALPYKDELGL